MTAPIDPRPGPPRRVNRCRGCDRDIWPLPEVLPGLDLGMWEDNDGIVVCVKRHTGDAGFVFHAPLPEREG